MIIQKEKYKHFNIVYIDESIPITNEVQLRYSDIDSASMLRQALDTIGAAIENNNTRTQLSHIETSGR